MSQPARPPAAVLFDRDGTLIHDVPYNIDPERVEPVAGAREVLDRLRAEGVKVGIVTNQSGVAKGLIAPEALRAVNDRVDALLGPFDVWEICPHDDGDRCDCRKPAPGLVLRAARRLGVRPEDCVVIGDIGRDMEAACAAGARGVLVPTPVTLAEEVAAAPEVAPDLAAAVDLVLGGIPLTAEDEEGMSRADG
ncbi:D-glycero-alpha-D-manno-heptose-1,7-bisphosphate 7-phosphatase [Microbispora hainanensis]|uniref:D-glycero-alpha-D-manno-heptose-1,7-bisphosphate 7-phosphatase n=1 Tax=Microbispora hainanensis TaxID=568844 RepID=UPI001FCB0D2B|nr:HAD family hydrolase [Microbispora hainanensis]